MGPCGVDNLNEVLRETFNPQRWLDYPEQNHPEFPELKHGKHTYRLRDKVLANLNDYQRGIFNGDSGIVVKVNKDSLTVDFGLGELQSYERSQLNKDGKDVFIPAFAITTHKSQGGEQDIVVMVIHSTHSHMLSRQLFYTAWTRARQKVFVIGDKKGFDLAIRNNSPSQRYTRLGELVREGAD
jgi:exodeoxyribonuclease V alpha subunit